VQAGHRVSETVGLLNASETARVLPRRDDCGSGSMFRGVERRLTPRHDGPRPGVILIERVSLAECTVRDFSPAGAGLVLPDAIRLPKEFDLTFDKATRHCVTVWRRSDRIGLRFKSVRGAAILGLVKDKAFDPDDVEIMDAAFQLVCRLLKLSNQDRDARSTAAVIIIELMARGDRIPSRLAYAAIRELETRSTVKH
jgi:PilZ domain